MDFRTKAVMPKEAESHNSKPQLGSYFKSTSLCPGGIRRDRAHVHGSASEVSIPTKMRGRDAWSIVLPYRSEGLDTEMRLE